jgi:hypothetical protein
MVVRKTILWVLSVSTPLSAAFAAPPIIAFERNDAAWLANLDGTDQKKIANGIFPAISPDATRIALTNVEKSGSNYVRHIAVVEIANGKTTIFKDVPSDMCITPSGRRMGSACSLPYGRMTCGISRLARQTELIFASSKKAQNRK